MALRAQVLGYNRIADVGGGGVADALAWFDDRAGAQVRVEPRREAPAGGFRGRPTPPAARRLQQPPQREQQMQQSAMPAGGRPGQFRRARADDRRQQQLVQQHNYMQPEPHQPQPQQRQRQKGAYSERGPVGAGGPDLNSFREYLLQQPSSYSAREGSAPISAPSDPPAPQNYPPLVGGGGGGAEVVASLGQLFARLTALENSEQTLQRTVAQQERELRIARQESLDAGKLQSLFGALEDRVRKAELAESGSSARVRALETALGEGSASQRERLHSLETEMSHILRNQASVDQQLQSAAGQQRELHGDLEGVHDKLAGRVEKYASALNEQIHRANEERLKLETSTRQLLHDVAVGVGEKMRNIETALLPGLESKLLGSVSKVQAELETSLNRVGTMLREVDNLRNKGDYAVHNEVKAVQELVKQGLLTLKKEAESQKAQVATVVRAEIQNRMLAVDSAAERMDEMQLNITEVHEAEAVRLAELREALEEQIGVVSDDLSAAREEQAAVRQECLDAVELLRDESEQRDKKVFDECMERLSQEDDNIFGKLATLQANLDTEVADRETGLNRAVGEAALLRGALDAAIGEWRDTAEAQKQQVQGEVQRLDSRIVDVNRQLVNEADGLRGLLQEAEGRLASRAELAAAREEAATASQDSKEAIEELVVRSEALEQLVNDEAERNAAAREEAAADVSSRLLQLGGDVSERLTGFRDFMDTEVESLSDRLDKLQGKLESDIKILGTAAHDELEARVSETSSRERKQREEAVKEVKSKLLVALKEQRISAKTLKEHLSRQLEEAEAKLTSLSQSIKVRVTAAEEKNTRVVANTHAEIDRLTAQSHGILTSMASAKDLQAVQETLAKMEADARRARTRSGPPPPPPEPTGGGCNPELEADVERHEKEIRQLQIRLNGSEEQSKKEDMVHRQLLTRLQERLQRSQARAQKDEEAIHALESDGNAIRQRLDSLDKRASSGEGRLEQQTADVAAVETRLALSEERLGGLDGRTSEHEGLLKGFADHIGEASEQMGAMTKTITALSASSTALQQASEDYYAVEQELRKDIANLEDRATTTETVLRPRVAALEAKVADSFAEQAEQLAAQGARVQAVEEGLEAQSARVTKSFAEQGERLTTHTTRVQALEEGLEAQTTRVSESLAEQAEQLAAQGARVQAAEEGLEAERSREASDITDLKTQLRALNESVTALGTAQKEEFEASRSGLQEQLTPLSEQVAKAQESVTEVKSALITESDTRLKGMELLRQELAQNDAMDPRERLEALDAKAAEHEKALKGVADSLAEGTEKVESLTAKVGGLESQFAQKAASLAADNQELATEVNKTSRLLKSVELGLAENSQKDAANEIERERHVVMLDRNIQQLRLRLDKVDEELHKHHLNRSLAADSAVTQQRVNDGKAKADDQLGERLRRKSQQIVNAQRAVAT